MAAYTERHLITEQGNKRVIKRTGIYISSLIMIALMMGGCEKEAIGNPDASSAEEGEAVQRDTDQPDNGQILQFTDAAGEQQEAVINESARRHTYDLDGLQQEAGRYYYYEDETLKSRTGIDVSRYQTEINWQQVKESGVDFVFVRLGYRGYGEDGEIQLDPMYESHIEEAAAAGLDVGVYFFSQAVSEEEALEEAEFVLEHLAGKEISMPVVFDPEEIKADEARTDDVTGVQFTKNTVAFCEKIKAAGYEPMVYANIYWQMFVFDMEQLQDYLIWYADYQALPQTPYQFACWQYSDKGSVAGVEGAVDLNMWIDLN